MATMLGNGELEMSTILFWQYLASIITVPCFLALYMYLISATFTGLESSGSTE